MLKTYYTCTPQLKYISFAPPKLSQLLMVLNFEHKTFII